MSQRLDMSLEDIIKQNREKRVQEQAAMRDKVKQQRNKTHVKAREFKKPERKERSPPTVSQTSLFITNLHFDVTNAQLREKAQESGKLVRLGINWDKLGKSKGTAEIEFSTAEEAQKALEQLNGLELEGRKISVKYAREQRD